MTLKVSKEVVRHKKLGCFRMITSPPWGSYLSPSEDPDGVELSEYELNGIKLIPDFPKIPPKLWSAYISLGFYLCPDDSRKMDRRHHDSILEVQVCLLRKADDLSQWKIIVPEQRVSGVSVKATLKNSIDIVTGERYKQFPPPGWKHAGTSHSHNRMDAFYSPTDDRSELNVPGLHIVIGDIDHRNRCYGYVACIVGRKQRKKVKLQQVVDATPLKQPFHSGVLDYVKEVVNRTQTYSFPGSGYTRTLFSTDTIPDPAPDKDSVVIGDEQLKDDDYIVSVLDVVADAIQVGGYTLEEIVEQLEDNRGMLGEPYDDDPYDDENVEIRIKDGVYEEDTPSKTGMDEGW